MTEPVETSGLHRDDERRAHGRQAMRWAIVGLVFGVVLIIAKWTAFLLTDSAAILSDAMESGVNVLSSAFVLYAVWLSNQPRDDDHPYGHGKVEYFSAGFEGALVLFAALSIAVVAISRLVNPVEIQRIELGLAAQLIISVVTLLVGQAVLAAGERLNSPSIRADGIHIRSDALTTFGTFTGLIIVWLTEILWLDTLIALIVAVWLGFSGAKVVREAVGGLMDEADPELLDEIAGVLESVREPGWISPHHAKIHHLGRAIHVDLHMVFPAYWSLQQTHAASERIEDAFIEEFGWGTELMLHMESCTPVSCSYCDVKECPIRSADFVKRNQWDGAHISMRHRAEPVSSETDRASEDHSLSSSSREDEGSGK
ncbi:MAG: cation diffusion facilitator family transporter [Myxococcota bacterium]|nr:cation diffusion facilitator family transporter [Myxococcota bacterium]